MGFTQWFIRQPFCHVKMQPPSPKDVALTRQPNLLELYLEPPSLKNCKKIISVFINYSVSDILLW
jgi:hypothetical protein